MGYILNRFDKLMELKQDTVLADRYKLTAVIVHDPKDTDLCNHIRKFFLKFAKNTGKNFLFITFIQPSHEYEVALKNGEYDYAKFMASDIAQGGEVERLVAPKLREYYDINDDGSYIVLARNLSDKHLYKIKITTESLPYQFMDLREYCDAPGNFEKLIENLEAEAYDAKEVLFDSLIKIVSLVSPSIGPNACRAYYWEQCEKALNTIREEKQKLLEAMNKLSVDQTEKVFELYNLIEHAYTKVLNEGKQVVPTIKCQNYSKLDKHSKRFWDTYQRLSSSILTEDCHQLDYSAFIIYLSKIIENELNLSVCQMLRHSMGVGMPSYYNRYCSSRDMIVIPTSKNKVPVNKHKNNRKDLESVPLGNLLHAYLTVAGKEISSDYSWRVSHPEYVTEISDDFIRFWKAFVVIRNEAAHPSEVGEYKYNNAKSQFDIFVKNYCLDLYNLKSKLHPVKAN